MTAMEVLLASGLFDSRSDIIRTIKQKGCKINGQVPDSADEVMELGDFLNFLWMTPNAPDMMTKHGRVFLMVSKGKRHKAIVKVMPDGTLADGVADLVDFTA